MADFINRGFEPAWQMVRPVPLVSIDFGNGTVLTRTLHGNIATYVCAADGQVLDVLPGIYAPTIYINRLEQLRLLAGYADLKGKQARQARLEQYHKVQAEALGKNQPPAILVQRSYLGKMVIEDPIKLVLRPGESGSHGVARHTDDPQWKEDLRLDSAEDLANWKALTADSKINETVSRLQVHEMLAKAGVTQPKGLTKWLYREVLHADLDDPYLGLGGVLFANYPFKDKAH